MASVYKTKNGFYYITYYPYPNKRKTIKGCRDKTATLAYARKIETEIWQRKMGLINDDDDKYAHAESKPLIVRDEKNKIVGGHLAEFHNSLLAKGITEKQAMTLRTRAARVLDLMKATRIAEMSPSGVQEVLGYLRKEEGLSLQTLNHYLKAIKQFSRWLWRDRRCRENRLVHLSGYNVRLDRRHDRRALDDDEVLWLISSTENGPSVLELSGADRAMLYRTALGTGFRRNELRSLTPDSFDLLNTPPTITVEAAYSKRRRKDVQPIREDLAEIIRPWLAKKRPGFPVFDMNKWSWHRTSEMLKQDLRRARETWIDAAGCPVERERREKSDFLTYWNSAGLVADFHALRHTYITNIGRAATGMKTHQELARHSEPSLTMRYTHPRLHDKTSALESLPRFDIANSAGPAATG